MNTKTTNRVQITPTFPSSFELKNPADYYSVNLLSNSGLTKFEAKIYELPGMNAKPETLRRGQLIHSGTYERVLFMQEPELVKFRSERDKANDALVNDVLVLADIARATPIIQCFLKHKSAIFEKDFYCLINGVPFKIKPDAMIQTGRGVINDLKSTACKNREDFIEKCSDYKYWRQAWLYMNGTGCKEFTFLGVSKTAIGKTFLVDVKNHKKEMKEAREEALELISMYVSLHPNYISNSLNLFKYGK